MKRNILIGSIVAATLVVLVSFASVVGVQQQDTINESSSPLFTVRTYQATRQTSINGITRFLGKGTPTDLFPTAAQSQEMIQAAIRMFSTNPALLQRLVDNLDQYPYLTNLLARYEISIPEIEKYLRLAQDNPAFLEDAVKDIQIPVPDDDDPQPLGLSTSNPIGCLIVAIAALVPITVVLTLLLLLFTVRILTCLNINDCANDIAEGIWNQLVQGLTEP